MDPASLTISLTELAQLAAVLSEAISAVIEARWSGDDEEVRERVSFGESQGSPSDAKYEQVFELGNCRIFLRFKDETRSLDQKQLRGLDLIANQVMRQLGTKQTSLEQQRGITQSAKMSALGEMASGIAHEINNPLAIIQGHLNKMRTLIENDILENEILMDSVQISAKTVVRVGKIVEGLRNFARDGGGDPFLKAELFQIVNETLSLCQERFSNHNIKMNVGAISRSLLLECRQVEISQVLLNLLSNAFDAVVDRPERWVDLKFADRGEQVEIRIIDSGNPIPREIRQKMFQPFFTTKIIGKGTGLGLSISKGIVEGHRGTIRLSDGDMPTEFVICLPKVQRAQGC